MPDRIDRQIQEADPKHAPLFQALFEEILTLKEEIRRLRRELEQKSK